ncbi:MAG: ankyrin repeat domain-containing protein [Holophagales bacterium]|jgi:hypothetical protein|nr:ankyrin repeat domain-containing protein [Holophagales bacterium]MBK9967171.1 ankyrin repeat domain-containing protein [Holophagales bacterium]
MKSATLAALLLCLVSLPLRSDDQPAPTRFAVAIEGGDVEAVKALLAEGNKPDTHIDYGENWVTPLMMACWHGEKEIVEALLAAGADVNVQAPDWRETALEKAVSRGHVEIARLLIDKGANLESRNKPGSTALALASAAGELEMVELLLSKKANPNAEDDSSFMPLRLAVVAGSEPVARALVANGAKVDKAATKYNKGETALHMAITQGKPEMVRVLLELKANPNARTVSGDTPMKLARNGDQEDVVRMLNAAGAR